MNALLLAISALGAVIMVTGLFVAIDRVDVLFSVSDKETPAKLGLMAMGFGLALVLGAMVLSYVLS